LDVDKRLSINGLVGTAEDPDTLVAYPGPRGPSGVYDAGFMLDGGSIQIFIYRDEWAMLDVWRNNFERVNPFGQLSRRPTNPLGFYLQHVEGQGNYRLGVTLPGYGFGFSFHVRNMASDLPYAQWTPGP
jgi:hypothetical protein